MKSVEKRPEQSDPNSQIPFAIREAAKLLVEWLIEWGKGQKPNDEDESSNDRHDEEIDQC